MQHTHRKSIQLGAKLMLTEDTNIEEFNVYLNHLETEYGLFSGLASSSHLFSEEEAYALFEMLFSA